MTGGNTNGGKYFRDLGVNGRIILKRILKKRFVSALGRFSRFSTGEHAINLGSHNRL
jgi:hypothetical protein